MVDAVFDELDFDLENSTKNIWIDRMPLISDFAQGSGFGSTEDRRNLVSWYWLNNSLCLSSTSLFNISGG
jgi:hypothetical protein